MAAINHQFYNDNKSLQPVMQEFTSKGNDALDAKWITEESLVPWLELDLKDVPYEAMYREALGVKDLFVTHRPFAGHGWKSLCIHGISPYHTDWYTQYDEYKHLPYDQVKHDWTEIINRCPETYRYFKDVFPHTNYSRIRFMLLEPGGYINPHSDNNMKSLCAINMALNNPEGCHFVFENYGIVPWKNTGNAMMLAVGNNHMVYNQSNEERIHMIIHGHSGHKSQEFNEMLIRSYQKQQVKFS